MNYPVEFEERIIRCVDCGNEFTWSAEEQAFFRDKGLTNEPKRCKTCREAKKSRNAEHQGKERR